MDRATRAWQSCSAGRRIARRHEIAARLFELMERHLGTQPFLAGTEPTIADVALYTYSAHAPEGGVSLEPYPQLRAWLARIEALPGFVGMAKSPIKTAA